MGMRLWEGVVVWLEFECRHKGLSRLSDTYVAKILASDDEIFETSAFVPQSRLHDMSYIVLDTMWIFWCVAIAREQTRRCLQSNTGYLLR